MKIKGSEKIVKLENNNSFSSEKLVKLENKLSHCSGIYRGPVNKSV